MRSEAPPQRIRPRPLNSELMAIRVAPAVSRTAFIALASKALRSGWALAHRSFMSGAWKEIMATPAVMLQKKTIHIITKRGEKIALDAEGAPVEASAPAAARGGVHPLGA